MSTIRQQIAGMRCQGHYATARNMFHNGYPIEAALYALKRSGVAKRGAQV